jgi:uncharacterized protein with GYD domain
MALYVHLVNMTEQGATRIKDQKSGYAEYGSYAESLGAKVVTAVACFGHYDYVVVVDYPDAAAALKGSGYIAGQGIVQTQTLPAFPVEDFFKAMSELPG